MTRPEPFLVVAAALLLASCGRTIVDTAELPPRDPIHLVVSGTDREMGLQHGKALAKEIAEEVGPRLKARFHAVATDASDARFLEDACRLYTKNTKPLLPPEVREELAGIAEGSGVDEDSILLLEEMREGLRFHLERPPLIEAALVSPPFSESKQDGPKYVVSFKPQVVAAWDGPGGAELAAHALLLERRPTGRAATLVVTWPGGLGALAGVSGAGVLVVESEVGRDREQQTLNGLPFSIGIRLALEKANSLREFFGALSPLSANRLLATIMAHATAPDEWGVRRLALLARVGGVSADSDTNAWVLFPAGPGGTDPRARSMDERLGGYPQRPDATQAIALAVSGRTSQAGPVIDVLPSGIRWLTGIGADGKPGPGSRDQMFEFKPPR